MTKMSKKINTRCPKKKCELLLVIVAVVHTFFGTPCLELLDNYKLLWWS